MTRLTYSDEPRDIWIVAETKDGALTPLTKELVYGARTTADMMGFYVKVALLGSGVAISRTNCIPSEPIACIVAEDDRLAEFALEPWLKVLSDLFVAQAAGIRDVRRDADRRCAGPAAGAALWRGLDRATRDVEGRRFRSLLHRAARGLWRRILRSDDDRRGAIALCHGAARYVRRAVSRCLTLRRSRNRRSESRRR